MDKKLNESQLKILMTLESEDALSYKELASLTGLSYDGVRGRVSELNQMGFNIAREKDGNITKLSYDGDVGREEGLSRPHTYGDLISSRMESLEDFYGITDFLNKVRGMKAKSRKKWKKFSDECGFLILSDLHFGNMIKEDGKVMYNTSDAFNRMETVTAETIANLKKRGIDELYIGLIGDIVDGDNIYKNHMFYVEKPAVEQVQDAVQSVSKLIKAVAGEGIKVEVGCVRGNHGITNYKNLEMDNWDNVVYNMLEIVFEDSEDVIINHFQTDEARVNVLDKSVVLYHGQNLRNQIKTSSGLKTFRGMCSKHGLETGDFIAVGHYHEFGIEYDQGKYLIRNGSLPDTSEYAWEKNLYGEPMQTLVILEEGSNYPEIVSIEV